MSLINIKLSDRAEPDLTVKVVITYNYILCHLITYNNLHTKLSWSSTKNYNFLQIDGFDVRSRALQDESLSLTLLIRVFFFERIDIDIL